jgi:hypothetical protein
MYQDKFSVKSLFRRFFDIQLLEGSESEFYEIQIISSFFDNTSIVVTSELLLLEVRKIFDLRTEIINC